MSFSCTASDQRIKNNITSLDSTSGLAAITALNPVSFYYKDGVGKPGLKFGLIAQEVQKIFPNLVGTSSPTAYTPNGTLTVDYDLLISPLIKAVQEVAAISDTFRTNLIAWLGNAGNGIGNLFANNLHAQNELCIGSTCINENQLKEILSGAGQSNTTNSANSASPTATSTENAISTPPTIQINGNNPATVNVGATYNDLGATITGPQQDFNLGILTYLNGSKVDAIQLDTSTTSTNTIDHVVTDQFGTTATVTRTVIVDANTASVQTSDASLTVH